MNPLRRLLPYLVSDATPLSTAEKLRSAFSAFFALLVVAWVSSLFLHGAGLPMMVASMGATAVILFATPHSPLAQPWPVVGGHLISAFIGVTCAKLVPEMWFSAALAVALSILAMHFSRSLHPPGGASALLPVLGNNYVHSDGYHFLVAPLGLNLLILFVMALAVNNLIPGHRWPARPFPKKDTLHRHDDPTPLDRLGIDKDDLHKALRDLDIYLDVSEEDLNLVYSRAGIRAFRRKMGSIVCGDIMSRDVATVSYDTDLEEAWAQLRYHKVKALPVLDADRRVVGILTLVDFLKRADLKTYEGFREKLVRCVRGAPGEKRVVGEIMAAPVVTAREDMHIVELVALLSDKGLHHIPVVDAAGRLAGMVTQSDLIAALYTGDANR